MAQLSTKVKLYCEANSKTADFGPDGNVILQDNSDGKGPYIASWTVDGLAKPTDEQIASYETAANSKDSLTNVLNKRQTEYLSWQEQLDKLYHDIDDGKLDKTGSWYTHIKAVKDANSKE